MKGTVFLVRSEAWRFMSMREDYMYKRLVNSIKHHVVNLFK